MGIDHLDLTYRVEREFEITLGRPGPLIEMAQEWRVADPSPDDWIDLRVREFVAWVEEAIVRQRPEQRVDVVERIQRHIVECLGVSAQEVTPDAWLRQDLGME